MSLKESVTTRSTVKRLSYGIFVFVIANAPTSDRKDLVSELELMKSLKPHPHVIKLIACVTESGNGDTFSLTSLRIIAFLIDLFSMRDLV